MNAWSHRRRLEAVRLAPVLAFAAVAPLLVRLPPSALARAVKPVARLRRRPLPLEQVVATNARVERALGIVARLAPPTCLTRGLTRYVFLRRAGLDVSLAFGMGQPDGSYAGHCWLELDGRPHFERSDPRQTFPELFRLPAGAA